MYIGMQATVHGTRRVYLRARDTETTTPFFDSFQTVRAYMNAMSCWGGADQSSRDKDDKGGMISWEIPADSANIVYVAFKILLQRLHFDVTDALFLASEDPELA